MNKTKKNGFFMAACLMLVVTMLATCIVSGTLAMFYSKGTVKGLTATVAKWSIEFNGSSISEGIDLSGLSWTIEDEPGISTGLPDSGEGYIAPGTWGYAEFTIENNGAVDADVEITGFEMPSDATSGGFSVCIAKDTPVSSGGETSFSERIKAGENITIYFCYQWLYDDEKGEGSYDSDDFDMGQSVTDLIFSDFTITATQAKEASD